MKGLCMKTHGAVILGVSILGALTGATAAARASDLPYVEIELRNPVSPGFEKPNPGQKISLSGTRVAYVLNEEGARDENFECYEPDPNSEFGDCIRRYSIVTFDGVHRKVVVTGPDYIT